MDCPTLPPCIGWKTFADSALQYIDGPAQHSSRRATDSQMTDQPHRPPPNLQTLEAELRSRYPDTLRLGYPRRYRVPDGWRSSAAVSVLMAHYYLGAIAREVLDRDEATRSAFLVASELYRNKVPTYFIGKELLPALLDTDPPDDMAAAEIPWPVPAAVFMLPNNALTSPNDGPIRFLAIARGQAGRTYAPHDNALCGLRMEHDALALWTVAEGPGLATYGKTARLEGTLADLMQDGSSNLISKDGVASALPACDAAFVARLTNIAASLLLLMAARPEMVESSDEVVKRIKAKSGGKKSPDDLWAPKWVGRNYRRPRPPMDAEVGSHASPRPHMRRGHWRRQRYGEGRADSKLVWIELTYVLSEKAGV